MRHGSGQPLNSGRPAGARLGPLEPDELPRCYCLGRTADELPRSDVGLLRSAQRGAAGPGFAQSHRLQDAARTQLMVRGQLQVAEIPIVFSQRGDGASKTNWRQRANALRHLGRLYAYRYGSLARAFSFSLVGASRLAVDAAFYLGLQAVGPEHRMARFLSF